MTLKAAVDQRNLSNKQIQRIDSLKKQHYSRLDGIGGDAIIEPIPSYISTPSEQIINNKNNAWVVLGRDRPGNRLSGYGGQGHTQAASIDIVVGRLGANAAQSTITDETIWVDPDFTTDAARIYLSQKADIDDYLNLNKGKVGRAIARSAIALKADGIRLVAREGIKLVTGLDSINSQGGKNNLTFGIDLIAGNDSTGLQPIPRGDNLSEAISRLAFHLDSLNGILDGFLHTQMNYNKAISEHWHYSPFYGKPTTKSFPLYTAGVRTAIDQLEKIELSLFNHKQNVANYRERFLNPMSEDYILSRHNNTN